MRREEVIAALGALAQESRLDIFRMLVQKGPDAVAAGEIARKLELPSPTLSFHLGQLALSVIGMPSQGSTGAHLIGIGVITILAARLALTGWRRSPA